jgi:hypothetical protein
MDATGRTRSNLSGDGEYKYCAERQVWESEGMIRNSDELMACTLGRHPYVDLGTVTKNGSRSRLFLIESCLLRVVC